MPASLKEAYRKQPTWNKNYYAGATRTNGARWNSLVNPALNKGAHNNGVVMPGPNTILYEQQNDFDTERLAQQEYLNEIRNLHDARLGNLLSQKKPAKERGKHQCMSNIYHVLACETCKRIMTTMLAQDLQTHSQPTLWSKDNLIIVMLFGLFVLLMSKG